MRPPTPSTPTPRTATSVPGGGAQRRCFNRCEGPPVAPSAYCAECSDANRHAVPLPLLPGSSRCRCGICGRTFRNLTGFDAHRPGDCLDPTALGMIERDGLWATPEGHADRKARIGRLSGRTDPPVAGSPASVAALSRARVDAGALSTHPGPLPIGMPKPMPNRPDPARIPRGSLEP